MSLIEPSIYMRAAERVVADLIAIEGELQVEGPPQAGVLSEEQQVQIYNQLLQNPAYLQVLRAVKGEDTFNAYVASMAEKTVALGKSNANLSPAINDAMRDDISSVGRGPITPVPQENQNGI